MQTPFLNPNPFNQWYGIKNVARVRVNWESCMALLDSGMEINAQAWGTHLPDLWAVSSYGFK